MKNIDITLQLHKLFLQGFEKPYYLTYLCNQIYLLHRPLKSQKLHLSSLSV